MSRPALPVALLALRAAYGAGLLLLPASALRALARAPVDHDAVLVARVLGARQLVQAGVLARVPRPRWWAAGAVVDALHAASMIALSRLGTGSAHRRLAAGDARSAALLAAGGLVGVPLRAAPGDPIDSKEGPGLRR